LLSFLGANADGVVEDEVPKLNVLPAGVANADGVEPGVAKADVPNADTGVLAFASVVPASFC